MKLTSCGNRKDIPVPSLPVVKKILSEKGKFSSIQPVPCDQRTRPRQAHKREIRLNGHLHGVHHLRNVSMRRKGGVAYAKTVLSLSSVKRQTGGKTFLVDIEGCPKYLVAFSQKRLLSLFRSRRKRISFYIQLN